MADDLIPAPIIVLVSIIGSLVCIYLSQLPFGGIFSIIATVLSVVLGTNTLRYIGKYSLGTGIPSIIYMLTASGLVSFIVGLTLASTIGQPMLLPIIALLSAAIIALIISMICKYIFKIEVEILAASFVKIAIASMLAILSSSTLIATGLDTAVIMNTVIDNGIIIFLMLAIVMSIQNPYNACMGPNEDQYRTLSLALANIFLFLSIISIISSLNSTIWYIYLAISLIGCIISLYKYFKYTKMQAASVRWSGLWSNNDEGDF